MKVRVVSRDIRLLTDISLSHVLSRDQILEAGYYSSVTRLNTRLRGLAEIGLVRRIQTPFFNQGLYVAGARAKECLDRKVSSLIVNRAASPRFLLHALTTTNVRLALGKRGATGWRFEQQLWAALAWKGKSFEVRPDGMSLFPSRAVAVEVDMGNVALGKLRTKLDGYSDFIESGACRKQWGFDSIRLLVATTTAARAEQILALPTEKPAFDFLCVPFETLGVPILHPWS